MTVSDFGTVAGVAIALAALIVSLVSLRKTSKFNMRQNELADTTERLNRILIERESAEAAAAKKADVSANVYEKGKHDYRLKVFNRGKGVARNVRLIDLDAGKRSRLIQSEIRQKFPLAILEQHQSVELIFSAELGSIMRAKIKLLWDDETGKDHEKDLTPAI